VFYTPQTYITEAGGSFTMVYLKIKRLIDIILSSIGLIILSPVFLVLIIAIKLDSPGPVLFKQKRVGIHKSHFHILKFRTMRIDTPKDTPTHLLENPDQWITKVGKFLRKTSLDELPQIINIFKGEMSIIGPRPALWNQYDLIKERDKYGANDVPVGLTGWAQINGRDEIPIEEKSKLDGEYVERRSIWFDTICFFGTITAVIRSKGVIEGGTGVIARMNEKNEESKGSSHSNS
jgi:O-antigen biosynthesis protein WbqP